MQALETLEPFDPTLAIERLREVLADVKGAGPILCQPTIHGGTMASFTLSVGTLSTMATVWRDADEGNLTALNCLQFRDSRGLYNADNSMGRDLALHILAITKAAGIDRLYTKAKGIGAYSSATYGPRPYGSLSLELERQIKDYIYYDPMARDHVDERTDWFLQTSEDWTNKHGTSLFDSSNNLKDLLDHLNHPITKGQYQLYGTVGKLILSKSDRDHFLQWHPQEMDKALQRARRPLDRETLDPRGFGLT